jgi:hygromycin-B 4-O-kinase
MTALDIKGRSGQSEIEEFELLQPVLNVDEVRVFLEEWAGGAVGEVSQFSSGQISSVFRFEVLGGGKYVARFVSGEAGDGLKKDRFIAPRAAAVGVPVPQVLAHGEVSLSVANLTDEERVEHGDGPYPLGFAICDLMPGEQMGDLQLEDRRFLIPTAIRTIDMISTIDVADTTGYGRFDGDGNAKYDSWRDYIAAQAFPDGGDNFYERRRDWFDNGFLEESVFQRITDRMMSLVARLPDVERSVVHMELGYDNALVVGSELSAALDWDNSIIGDHLYDGAWHDLYAPDLDFKRLFTERYAETGRVVERLDDRWLVCELHVGLQALQWYGFSKNEPAYHWMKARVLHVMGEGPPVGRHPEAG